MHSNLDVNRKIVRRASGIRFMEYKLIEDRVLNLMGNYDDADRKVEWRSEGNLRFRKGSLNVEIVK